MLQSLCVYCGAKAGLNPAHIAGAQTLAKAMADKNLRLVYGGASVGVMGALADACLAAGAEVIGVMPAAILTKEIRHPGLTEFLQVSSMHERKAKMAELADGFIALPGGWGTLEEIFEIVTWAQLGLHQKPCGLLNVQGYYNGLVAFIDRAVDEGFIKPEHRALLMVERNVDALLERMSAFDPPPITQWLSPDET